MRGVTKAATKPTIRPAMISKAGFNMCDLNKGGRHRGHALFLLLQRRRLSVSWTVVMVLLTAMEKVEDPMGMTVHENAREAVERIQRGIFPQELPWNRQRRIAGISMETRRIAKPVACLGDTGDDGRIEAAVGVRKMRHRLAELFLKGQQ